MVKPLGVAAAAPAADERDDVRHAGARRGRQAPLQVADDCSMVGRVVQPVGHRAGAAVAGRADKALPARRVPFVRVEQVDRVEAGRAHRLEDVA